MSSSVIRQIIRGITSISSETDTIECTIVNTNKVIVLLNGAIGGQYDDGCYLVSVSNTNIQIAGKGSISRIVSYQIVEFM